MALARLGRHDEALELANRLVEENPPEKDAQIGNSPVITRAMVRGLSGDADGAIKDVRAALALPGATTFTPLILHYDPNWDFLRDDPRFVALASPEPAQN